MKTPEYLETEKALLDRLGSPPAPEALEALAELYSFVGKTLWCFEFNREPDLSSPVLSFESWEDFEAFLQTVPEALSWEELLTKAAARLREAIALRKAPASAGAEAQDWLSLARILDRLPDDAAPLAALAEARRLFESVKDDVNLGETYLALAHSARYRTYELDACRELLEKARACYRRAGSAEGESLAGRLLRELKHGG